MTESTRDSLDRKSSKATNKSLQSGFSLLVLLIALAIFALVGAMAYAGLGNMLKAEAHGKA